MKGIPRQDSPCSRPKALGGATSSGSNPLVLRPPGQHPAEEDRLRSLECSGLLDTPAEQRFDRITRLARRMFRVPIVLISLVDGERQWFKSRQGLAVPETDRDISFCGHAVADDRALIVEDALADVRFADNPLVQSEPHIRFYAGYPIHDVEGLPLGTLCLIDREPRRFDRGDRVALEDFAWLVERELQRPAPVSVVSSFVERTAAAERRRMLDVPTGAWNEPGFRALLQFALQKCRAEGRLLALVFARLRGEGREGWTRGDADLVRAEVAQELSRAFDAAIGRYEGDEFLMLAFDRDEARTGANDRDGGRHAFAPTPSCGPAKCSRCWAPPSSRRETHPTWTR